MPPASTCPAKASSRRARMSAATMRWTSSPGRWPGRASTARPARWSVTSRVSVEMVQKAAAIGAPIIIAVSAPTALAIRTAEAAGMTLVALVRGDEFDVFTHPERMTTRSREECRMRHETSTRRRRTSWSTWPTRSPASSRSMPQDEAVAWRRQTHQRFLGAADAPPVLRDRRSGRQGPKPLVLEAALKIRRPRRPERGRCQARTSQPAAVNLLKVNAFREPRRASRCRGGRSRPASRCGRRRA